jgi:hypothetical protein
MTRIIEQHNRTHVVSTKPHCRAKARIGDFKVRGVVASIENSEAPRRVESKRRKGLNMVVGDVEAEQHGRPKETEIILRDNRQV